jgi:hypothetical protein
MEEEEEVFPGEGLSQPPPEWYRFVNQWKGGQARLSSTPQAVIRKASICQQRLSAVFPAQLPPH